LLTGFVLQVCVHGATEAQAMIAHVFVMLHKGHSSGLQHSQTQVYLPSPVCAMRSADTKLVPISATLTHKTQGCIGFANGQLGFHSPAVPFALHRGCND